MEDTRRVHFVNNALSELENANHSPIYGYQHLPIMTLEESTEKLIPLIDGMANDVSIAKNHCKKEDLYSLTHDESAAIYLYTMATSFFRLLNEALRSEDRHALEPCFGFLKLFITALQKIPSTKRTVWRGVAGDVGSVFADGDIHIWWSINSCSLDLKVVERYLSNPGTLFAIDVIHGKNISAFSAFPEEQEIILMPGTSVSAKNLPLTVESSFFLIDLKEEDQQR